MFVRSMLVLLAMTAGGIVGLVSALWATGRLGGDVVGATYALESDYWQGNLAVGSREAGRYTRARIAKRGLLALSREEAIYFSRDQNETGARLREECDYLISGSKPPARWWSVTLYAHDDFLAQNDDDAHSIGASTSGANTTDWSVMISRENSDASHWLSSEHAGGFSLTLRLYNPEPDIINSPQSIDFPKLETVSCREDGS